MNEFVKDEVKFEEILDYYDTNYYCSNCNEHFTKWIKKGYRKPTVSCPNCDVNVTQ